MTIKKTRDELLAELKFKAELAAVKQDIELAKMDYLRSESYFKLGRDILLAWGRINSAEHAALAKRTKDASALGEKYALRVKGDKVLVQQIARLYQQATKNREEVMQIEEQKFRLEENLKPTEGVRIRGPAISASFLGVIDVIEAAVRELMKTNYIPYLNGHIRRCEEHITTLRRYEEIVISLKSLTVHEERLTQFRRGHDWTPPKWGHGTLDYELLETKERLALCMDYLNGVGKYEDLDKVIHELADAMLRALIDKLCE